MAVIPIRKPKSKPVIKLVEANQKAVDALALDSGMWKIKGVPGLYVRCRAKSKSFLLQRRIDGHLVKSTLGPVTVKKAKEDAMKQWGTIRRNQAAEAGVLTLGAAIEQYVIAKTGAGKMAPKTAKMNRYNADRYLEVWKKRTLQEVGTDRIGIRALQERITRKHRRATSNQVIQLLSAVYRWCREIDSELPEWPRKAAEIHNIKPRDWAYSPEELRTWWHAVVEKEGKPLVHNGVSTLNPLKRMWWLTALFTGARKGSIEALKWADVDLEKNIVHFRVAKGDRPYMIPISDKLAELLTAYKESGDVPPSEWLFPSPLQRGSHVVDVKNVREGVGPAHRLRHTFRTTLAELGAGPDQARMLMGHSMGGDVSRGYITSSLVTESLRPITNSVAKHFMEILGQV